MACHQTHNGSDPEADSAAPGCHIYRKTMPYPLQSCEHQRFPTTVCQYASMLTLTVHRGTKNVHLLYSTVVSTNAGRFIQYLAYSILKKFATQYLFICPPQLHTVATVPWEKYKPHKSDFNNQNYTLSRIKPKII